LVLTPNTPKYHQNKALSVIGVTHPFRLKKYCNSR
jgi:hypothetical protein